MFRTRLLEGRAVQPSTLLCRSKAESCLGTQRVLTFRKCKCSWMTVFTVPTEGFVSCAISRQVMRRLSRIRRSTHWMFTGMTAVGWNHHGQDRHWRTYGHLWNVYTIQMSYCGWESHHRTVFYRYPRGLRLRSQETSSPHAGPYLGTLRPWAQEIFAPPSLLFVRIQLCSVKFPSTVNQFNNTCNSTRKMIFFLLW